MSTPGATDDAAEMAVVLGNFFAAVSFRAVARPDYSAIHGLFSEGARLIRNGGDAPEISSVDEFILPRQLQVDSGELTSFEEVELAHITEDSVGRVRKRADFMRSARKRAHPRVPKRLVRRRCLCLWNGAGAAEPRSLQHSPALLVILSQYHRSACGTPSATWTPSVSPGEPGGSAVSL